MKLSFFFPIALDDLSLRTKKLSKAFFQDYKTWVKQTTQKIVLEASNFQIIINLSLFTFAFSQMVFWRYKENSFSYFLRNNVPGVCYPFQTVSWDTFSTFFTFGSENQLQDTQKIPCSLEQEFFNKQELVEDSKNYTNPASNYFLSTFPKKASSNIHIYPDSILVSPDSEYFKHTLFDIGILPYKNTTFNQEDQMQKNNLGILHNANQTFTFHTKKTDESLSKVSWRSFFSHRLDSNLDFFQDEFPTKLDSDLYETFSEAETRSLLSSDSNNESLLTQSSEDTFNESRIGLNEKKNSTNIVKQKNPKLPQSWETGVIVSKTSDQQKASGIPLNLVQKAMSLQSVSTFFPNCNFSSTFGDQPTQFVEVETTKTIFDRNTERKESKKRYSRKMKLFLKQSFFLKQIANIAYDFDILPQNSTVLFSHVEPFYEENSIEQKFSSKKELIDVSEKHTDSISSKQSLQVPVLRGSTSTKVQSNIDEDIDVNEVEEIFPEELVEEKVVGIFEEESNQEALKKEKETFFDEKTDDQKILHAMDTSYRPNPTRMGHATRQSGFLYPDTSHVTFLEHQTAFQKNPFLYFSKKAVLFEKLFQDTTSHKTWKRCSVPKNHNTILFIDDFLNKEKFQCQEFFTEIASQVNIKRSHSKKTTNSGVEKSEIFNSKGLDIRFTENNEINIWQKKYFSQDTFGTDRKSFFFGFVPSNEKRQPSTQTYEQKIRHREVEKQPSKILFNNLLKKLEKAWERGEISEKNYLNIDGSLRNYFNCLELAEKPEISKLKDDSFIPRIYKRLPVIVSAEKWEIPNLDWENFEKKNISFRRIAIPKVISQKNAKYVPFDSKLPTTHTNSWIKKDCGNQAFPVFQPWPLTSLDYKPCETRIFFQKTMHPSVYTFKERIGVASMNQSFINQEFSRKRELVNIASRQPTLFSPKCTDVFSCFFPWSRSHAYHNSSQDRFDIAYTRTNPFFQKTVSSGQKTDLTRFQSPFEPLTKNSWLILHKISCSILAFQLIQRVVIPVIEEVEFFSKKKKEKKSVFQIKQSKKGFQNIAGIDDILSDLSEIVLFFRQKGRSLAFGKVIPKGILFVGPPGTGKTFVVRAVAGEAGVPVLLQSGSTFHSSSPSLSGETSMTGPQQLQKLFSQARQLAPCILFIDEIDALGQKRYNVIEKSSGQNGLLDTLALEKDASLSLPSSALRESNRDIKAYKTGQSDSFNNGTKLNLLTQFLVEMDGLQSREGVIVIGATNRPDALDPAFLRPGRFDKILQLELPEKQKRIQILKLYSKNIGIDPRISWEYLANRTEGCSAADLSAAMNESSIQAILHDTYHTVETIEQGLHSIENFIRQKPFLSKNNSIFERKNKDPFVIQRLAFSQVGKAILFQLLPQHPPCVFVYLWEPWLDSKNRKSFLKQRKRVSVSFETRFHVENRLIGLYAGKASELLLVSKNSQRPVQRKSAEIFPVGKSKVKRQELTSKASWLTTRVDDQKNNFHLWESDINKDDIQQATLLAYSMINEWHFYSDKLFLKKNTFNLTNQNREDLFLKPLLQTQPINDHEKTTTSLFPTNESFYQLPADRQTLFQILFKKAKTEVLISLTEKNEQTTSLRSWWQNNILAQPGSLHEDWFRIYVSDPEQSIRNEEFVFSDNYYYSYERPFNVLNTFPYSMKQEFAPLVTYDRLVALANPYKKVLLSWNDFYAHSRDSLYQGVLTSSLNKAFLLLNKNREMVDFFADFILRHEIMRENTISSLFSKFYTVQKQNQ